MYPATNTHRVITTGIIPLEYTLSHFFIKSVFLIARQSTRFTNCTAIPTNKICKRKIDAVLIIYTLPSPKTDAMHTNKTLVFFFSKSCSIALVDEIAGTEHPEPIINGINDFPLSPI